MLNRYFLMPVLAVAALICASPSMAQPVQITICIENDYNYYPMFACKERYPYKGNGVTYYVGKKCTPPIRYGQVVENLTYSLNKQLYVCPASVYDPDFANCDDAPILTVTQAGLYTINRHGSIIPPDPKSGKPCPVAKE